jgi:hypothetical protein
VAVDKRIGMNKISRLTVSLGDVYVRVSALNQTITSHRLETVRHAERFDSQYSTSVFGGDGLEEL